MKLCRARSLLTPHGTHQRGSLGSPPRQRARQTCLSSGLVEGRLLCGEDRVVSLGCQREAGGGSRRTGCTLQWAPPQAGPRDTSQT